MSSYSRFQDKIDVLDIIISILKDHEKSLSSIVDRLGAVSKTFSSIEKEIIKLDEMLKSRLDLTHVNGRRLICIECKKWSEFKKASIGASLITFETKGGVFSISSVSGEFLFKYSEKLPNADEVIPIRSGGLGRKVLRLNPVCVRRWLLEEFKVSEERVFEGSISMAGLRR